MEEDTLSEAKTLLWNRIEYMKGLQAGWLGDDSIEVDTQILRLAHLVALKMLSSNSTLPQIGSAGDGSVDLTWKGIYLTLYKTKFLLTCLTNTSSHQVNYPPEEFVVLTIKKELGCLDTCEIME